MRTITSMLCTRDGARLALRTSRVLPSVAICRRMSLRHSAPEGRVRMLRLPVSTSYSRLNGTRPNGKREPQHQNGRADAEDSIYNFRWSLINQSKRFLDLLGSTEVSIEEWYIQSSYYRNRRKISRVRSGFVTFFLNRCNRSGIIVNGGPIGGINQEGRWKVDARFNKVNLAQRCKGIAEYKGRISVSCDDGIEFIGRMSSGKTMLFIDPPYFGKGPTLYLDCLDEDYHQSLACKLRSMCDKAWLLTYDDCAAVRSMYPPVA